MAIFGTYVGNNLVLTAPKYGGRLYCQADDIYLTPLLVCHGVHEGALTNWISRNIKPGMTCVDIGANMGYFTVLLGYVVGPTGRVVAVEPIPSTMDILETNIAANYLKDQTITKEMAVGSVAGQTTMFFPKGMESCSSVHEGLDYFQDVDLERVRVQLRTLDSILRDEEHIDFIKIDVEGNEFNVFQGGRETFAKTDVIALEVNKKVLGKNYWPLMDTLREYIDSGWRLAVPTPDGNSANVPLDWLLEQEFVNSAMLFAPCLD